MWDQKINEAIILAEQADHEFIGCNMNKARELYVKAADLLMTVSEVQEGMYERNAINYSAAVLYFNGGEYNRSLATAGIVNSNCLRSYQLEIAELYSRSKERTVQYPSSIIQEIQKTVAKARDGSKPSWEKILLYLRDHPYAMQPFEMTKLRCEALVGLDRHEEAEMFKKDLERLKRETGQQINIINVFDGVYTKYANTLVMIMKHSFLREATECLLDVERMRGFSRAINRVVKSGDIVLDCGTGTGVLAAMAVKDGAKIAVAIEQDRYVAEVAVNNIKNSGTGDKVQIAHGDASAFKGHVDVAILEMLNTMLITEEQVRVANALIAKGVIDHKTKVIPLMCSNFFEFVYYDFDFYDFHMPMIIQSRNGNERCGDILSNATMYNQVVFNNHNEPNVHYEGRHMIHTKGYLNALKFTMVTHLTDDILIGSTNDMNVPIYVPVHEMLVKAGDVINVSIDYIMGSGFETLKVDIN